MEELIKNDEFVQYIINQYFPANDMSYHEKIQNVFSSLEDFSKAMESFKLNGGGTNEIPLQPGIITSNYEKNKQNF